MRTWTYTWAASAVLHGLLVAVLALPQKGSPAPPAPIHVRIITSGQASGGGHGTESRMAHAPQAAARSVVKATRRAPAHHSTSLTAAKTVTHRATAMPAAPTNDVNGAGGQGIGLSGDHGLGLGHGPRLIRTTVRIPGYTDDALDANFEGLLVVEVTVDADGHVLKATLRNPSGYQIDAGVLAAARAARYQPAVTRDGRPTLAMARVNFNFRMP